MSRAAKAPKTKAPVANKCKGTAPKNKAGNHKGTKAKNPDIKNSLKQLEPPTTPCSFAEPILRICKSKAKGNVKCDTNNQAPSGPDQNGPQAPQIKLFYRQKAEGTSTDIIGPREINRWKESTAGRHKTWKACRRLKPSGTFLEQLVSLHGEHVAFGWQFSTISMPSAFLRGLGRHVNAEPPHSKARKRSAASMDMKFIEGMSDLYDQRWPLPLARPTQFKRVPRARNYRPATFSRLVFSSRGFTLKQEESLAGTKFAARLFLPKGNNGHGEKGGVFCHGLLLDFVLHGLVRNDDYADIYMAVQDLAKPTRSYRAHVFLSEGLSERDLRRKRERMKRLRASRDFHAETTTTTLASNSFAGDEAHLEIILMKSNDDVGNPSDVFRLHNTAKNFPVLPETGKISPSSGFTVLQEDSGAPTSYA